MAEALIEPAHGRARSMFRAIGPAVIVASVVLGPGSIYLASAIGIAYGYALLWVVAFATALMICIVAMAARLGVVYERTLCEELAHRLGRPFAVLIGIVVFLIVTAFQTGNNVAVLFAIDPVIELATGRPADQVRTPAVSGGILLVLNAGIIAVLLGFKRIYRPLERLMIALVMMMLVGFAANLIFARPDLLRVLGGLIPSLPPGDRYAPYLDSAGRIVDPLAIVVGFFATTVSIAGAAYQAYLVKEKGWTVKELRSGLIDSLVGIAVLGVISAVIMITAAAVLHGTSAAQNVDSAADVARQLEPLFGPAAVILFSGGFFAGAFSSFMINAIIGGTFLADGLGIGGRMDHAATRYFTVAALLISMGIALAMGGTAPSVVITVAQMLTVLGLPLLAFSLLYLATRPGLAGERAVPGWMKLAAAVAFVVTIALAARTAWRLWLQLSPA